MRFRNAFRMFVNNFGNVYKLLLFRLVTNVLVFSLMYAVITLGLHVIFSSAEAKHILSLIGDFFTALTSGKTEFLVNFRTEFVSAQKDLLLLLGANIGSIVGSIIGVVLLFLVGRFLNGTALFATASILNDRMAFYGITRFSSAYFRDLARATLYQVIYVPLSFVFDLLSLVACWFLFFFIPSLLTSWGFFTILLGLSLSVAAFICLESLKMTFISAWLPAVVSENKGVGAAFKESFRARRGFAGRFSTYLIALYLLVVLNLMFGIFTLGSLLIISIPASHLFILSLQFVHYYEDNNKKYFLSFRKISGADGKPEGMGD